MPWGASIFLEANFPNPTSWFYSALVLVVALFFRFDRLFSLRHLDLLLLFLWMPGLLLLLEQRLISSEGINRWPYAWLLGGTLLVIIRALVDLAFTHRPSLKPNLNAAGLCFFSLTLFGALVLISIREPNKADAGGPDPSERVKPPTTQVREQTEAILQDRFMGSRDTPTARLVVERGLALGCHLATAFGLFMIGWRHFQHGTSGVAAACMYLLLPYTFMLTPFNVLNLGRWDSAFPMALWVWAIFWMGKPLVSGLFMGLATGTMISPFMVLPTWCGFYWRKGMDRFLLAFLLAILPCFFWAPTTWVWSDWFPWLEPDLGTDSFWHGIHWAYRTPIFVIFLSVSIASFFWPENKNLGQLISLNLALLAGVELWQADRGGTHLFSFLAPAILMVFRPTLDGGGPPKLREIWLDQLWAWFGRAMIQFFRGFYSLWRVWAGPSLAPSEPSKGSDSKITNVDPFPSSVERQGIRGATESEER